MEPYLHTNGDVLQRNEALPKLPFATHCPGTGRQKNRLRFQANPISAGVEWLAEASQ